LLKILLNVDFFYFLCYYFFNYLNCYISITIKIGVFMTSALLIASLVMAEPNWLYLSDQPVPVKQFINALEESGYPGISQEPLNPLGPNGSMGWDAYNADTRFLFQGEGQFADIHRHDRDESSYIAFGAAHVWTHEFDDWTYAFYKQGDTITIPAGVPHTLVAASHIGQNGIKQCGVLMIRSAEKNPQLPTITPLKRPTVIQEAFERMQQRV
jgi:hypothetical protein